MNKFIIHIITFFAVFTNAVAQDTKLYKHKLDENKWQDIRKNIRYENHPDGPGREWTYENKQEYQREQKKYNGGQNGNGGGGNGQGDGGRYDGSSQRQNESREYNSPPPNMSVSPGVLNGLGVFGYILLGAFIILIAVLIFYLFVNRKKDGKKIERFDLEEQAPTEIPLTELQRLLQEALNKGDFRAAVRIYFIFIIRDLAQKNWIKWEKDKTNFQYLREMSGKSDYTDFNRSVSYFEIIWYGKREIDRPTFEKIQPDFTRFLDKLGVR